MNVNSPIFVPNMLTTISSTSPPSPLTTTGGWTKTYRYNSVLITPNAVGHFQNINNFNRTHQMPPNGYYNPNRYPRNGIQPFIRARLPPPPMPSANSSATMALSTAAYQSHTVLQTSTAGQWFSYSNPMALHKLAAPMETETIIIKYTYLPDDPLQQQHGSSRESHQNDTKGGDAASNDLAKNQNQKQQQQRNQKGAANKARNNNGGNNANSNNSNNNKRYEKEQTYNHPWLASTLKGHTKEIRDMDFSSNGKFLASCAEDNLIRRHNSGHRDSTTSDLAASGDDVNSSSSNEDLSATFQQKANKKSTKSRRNRRQQRKNLIEPDEDVAIKDNDKQSMMTVVGVKAQRKQGKLNAIKTIATSASNKNNNNNGNNSDNNNNKGSTTSLSSTSSSSSLSSSASSSASSSPSNSPTGSPTPRVNNFLRISRALAPPLRQHTKLNLQEHELVQFLRKFIINKNLLGYYGFPVDSLESEGCVEIYKCWPRAFIVPGKYQNKYTKVQANLINSNDGLYDNSQIYDSGRGSGSGSGSSSPTSLDSDLSEGGEEETTNATTYSSADSNPHMYSQNHRDSMKQCARCKSHFRVTENGEYLTKENCIYHWGKAYQVFIPSKGLIQQYTCCNGDSKGCSKNNYHVWSGVVVGLNGPYTGFMRTQPKRDCNYQQKIYALDCEMCYTGLGLECTKITVVGSDGQMVYEYFVRPQCEIVDYNTRFSGITEKDLNLRNANVKTLEDVQKDLLQLFDADTILIGHALENDLRVLRILHYNIIDTSVSFPHASGFPYRRALKNLTKAYLNRDIQTSESGHSSFEDSRACLELMLWKVRKEFRLTLEQ